MTHPPARSRATREEIHMHGYPPPGTVPVDDPEVHKAMAIVDGLTETEQRELVRSAYRAALAFKRSGDVDHATRFATNLLATVHLRSIPAYAEALRNAPRHRPQGQAIDVEDVLNWLESGESR
uniref:hypothetical protein n=1 Tax=Sphaerisporangium sp. CA-236357 TaxID=3240030 RepID=UPI003F496C82